MVCQLLTEICATRVAATNHVYPSLDRQDRWVGRFTHNPLGLQQYLLLSVIQLPPSSSLPRVPGSIYSCLWTPFPSITQTEVSVLFFVTLENEVCVCINRKTWVLTKQTLLDYLPSTLKLVCGLLFLFPLKWNVLGKLVPTSPELHSTRIPLTPIVPSHLSILSPLSPATPTPSPLLPILTPPHSSPFSLPPSCLSDILVSLCYFRCWEEPCFSPQSLLLNLFQMCLWSCFRFYLEAASSEKPSQNPLSNSVHWFPSHMASSWVCNVLG